MYAGGASPAGMTFPASPAREALEECAVQRWLPVYRRHTFETRLISVDKDLCNWLVSDGVSASGDNRAVRASAMVVGAQENEGMGPCRSWLIPLWLGAHRWILQAE